MSTYSVPALLNRFDRRIPGETSLTGKMSSLIGELVLVEVVAHALSQRGHSVELLEGVPHRDNAILGKTERGWLPRDLDAWLRLDGTEIVAVEAKTWTASSLGGKHVDEEDPGALATIAKHAWRVAESDLASAKWTETNKVAMPIRAPIGSGVATEAIRRILVFWWPVSSNGLDPWSECLSETMDHTGAAISVRVEVFSASLYLRALRQGGELTIPAVITDPTRVLDAIQALIRT